MSRHSMKRDVIVISDDESTSEPKAKKNGAKAAESAPSSYVTQLQLELVKSERKFKDMFDMACEYKTRVEFLTKQLEEEREGRMRDRERVEPVQQQPVIVKEPPPDEKPIVKGNGVASDMSRDMQTSGAESTDILLPCDTNSAGSIPFDIAREFLHSRYVKCNLESLVQSCDVMNCQISNCDACEKKIIGIAKMFHHLFSKDHADKMLARNVSQAAVYYWKEKLEQSTTTVATGNTCNSTNILQSFDSPVPETISYWSIRTEFERNFNKCDVESLLALCANQFFACEECGVNNLDANQASAHFLSKEHSEKMSHHRVSLTAKWYWLEKLYQAKSTINIHNICHPTNLFQLCRSQLPEETISIYWARDILYSLRNIGSTDYVNHKLYCELCKMNVHMHEVVGHLFGNAHIQEAKAAGSDRISLAAVRYWRQLLQQKEDERRRKEQQHQQRRGSNWSRRRHHTSGGGDDMY